MARLFLSPPPSDEQEDRDAVNQIISLLEKVESVICSAMVSGGRHEARLWLCNTIASIHSLTVRDQCDLFVNLLRLDESKYDVAAQLLQIFFEKKPDKAGSILAIKIHMLEKFFEGNPKRILAWFDFFATIGESGHKNGARALSKFAFRNRDTCWEELEWRGRHGQSPAVVATKPHYLHDLDVLQTVENFLEYVPDFWSSEELVESVKDGEILKIDRKYFLDKFLQLMYEENMEELWVNVKEFIMNEQFSFLCQHLLLILDDSRMLTFIKSIGKHIRANAHCMELKYQSCWLEILLSTCSSSLSIDELVLLNAMISHGRKLIRLITDEEHVDEKQKLEKVLENAVNFCDADYWAFLRRCTKMNKQMAIKMIGIQSWILHHKLILECKTQESFESLFARNGISFRKADEFNLVQSIELSEEHGAELDDEDLHRQRHKSKKKDKKRKRRKNHVEGKSDQLLVLDQSNILHDWQSGGSWLLETDQYSCAWNAVDLPEHLSQHCFSTWMKWVLSKW